jgi:hypothetical protein
MGLGTNDIIMGLLVAVVLLSVLVTEEAKAQRTPPPGGGGLSVPPVTPEEKQEFVDTTMNETISHQLRLNQTAQTLIAQDPQFKTFTEIWVNCLNHLGYLNGTISEEQCNTTFDEGTNKWCGLEQYNIQKCEYASKLVLVYENMRLLFQGFEVGIFEPFEPI